MAKYHITPKGPALCHANPDKPGGRACRYSSEVHFKNEKEAEAAFVAKEGLEQSSTSLSKKPPEQEAASELKTVWKDGEFVRRQTFTEVQDVLAAN